jgi:flagellar hook-length control protein FliK
MSRANAGIQGGDPNANGELPAVDPARFIGRVAKAFQTAHDRGGTLQLRLSPPELGSLRLELTVKDGVMNASLQTENANARRLLLDHLPALRDRLAEQNIRVDRFDVDVRRDGTGNQTDAHGSQQQAFQNQSEQPSPRRQPTQQVQVREAVRAETAPVAPTISDAGLNLIV